jgi:hypothetical protein
MSTVSTVPIPPSRGREGIGHASAASMRTSARAAELQREGDLGPGGPIPGLLSRAMLIVPRSSVA